MKAKTRLPKMTPPVSFSPRSEVPQQLCPTVDAVLKDLKVYARRLHGAILSQRIELQVLDQLYYKGNNQHRTALFWNRVQEVRRYGRRLEQLEVFDIVEVLRFSFWGTSPSVTQKSLKGAWTHVPDARTVHFALARLRACLSLMDKMDQCLTKAYAHLNLNLQTGAFLQLILTLSGITSRLAMLLGEMRPIMEAIHTSISKILGILHTEASSAPRGLEDAGPSNTRSSARVEHLERKAADPTQQEGPPKIFTAAETLMAVSDLRGPEGDLDEQVDAHALAASDRISFRTPKDLGFRVQSSTHRRLVNSDPAGALELELPLDRKLSRPPSTTAAKKKKKRDAIDDIFGF